MGGRRPMLALPFPISFPPASGPAVGRWSLPAQGHRWRHSATDLGPAMIKVASRTRKVQTANDIIPRLPLLPSNPPCLVFLLTHPPPHPYPIGRFQRRRRNPGSFALFAI